jgi:mRNA-degrading endonuclease RelE of RelBE toxin-antitoxin system
VKSRTIHPFYKLLRALSQDIQQLARENFLLWKENPHHPSVKFERKKKSKNIYSARIGDHYRALAFMEADIVKWFWIGSHADYDNLLVNLKAVVQGKTKKARAISKKPRK